MTYTSNTDYVGADSFTFVANDVVVTSDFPSDINGLPVSGQSVTALSHPPQVTSVVLNTAGSAGEILAGIPKATLTVSGEAQALPVDPILFLGVGVRSADSDSDTLVMANQVRPIRGYGNHDV